MDDGTVAAKMRSNNVVLAGVVGGNTVNLSKRIHSQLCQPQRWDGNRGGSEQGDVDGANAGNYTLTQPMGLNAYITPVTLTVSAANKSKTYGLLNLSLTVSYSGFVNSEGTNVLAGAPSLSTSATTNSPPGIYAITAGTEDVACE